MNWSMRASDYSNRNKLEDFDDLEGRRSKYAADDSYIEKSSMKSRHSQRPQQPEPEQGNQVLNFAKK